MRAVPSALHIVLIGPMAAGKTTLGRRLADRSGATLRDSDVDIEALTGRWGREIAREHGVPALHALEAGVLLGALAAPVQLVITAAASVVEAPWVIVALDRRAVVVHLDLSVDDQLSRLDEDDHRRTTDRRELDDLAARRRPAYEAVADVTLDAAEGVDELVAAAWAVIETR